MNKLKFLTHLIVFWSLHLTIFSMEADSINKNKDASVKEFLEKYNKVAWEAPTDGNVIETNKELEEKIKKVKEASLEKIKEIEKKGEFSFKSSKPANAEEPKVLTKAATANTNSQTANKNIQDKGILVTIETQYEHFNALIFTKDKKGDIYPFIKDKSSDERGDPRLAVIYFNPGKETKFIIRFTHKLNVEVPMLASIFDEHYKFQTTRLSGRLKTSFNIKENTMTEIRFLVGSSNFYMPVFFVAAPDLKPKSSNEHSQTKKEENIETELQEVNQQIDFLHSYKIDKYQEDSDNILAQDKKLAVHGGTKCDACKICPILGDRYHCQGCGNIDLCQNCYQEEAQHKLNLLKYYKENLETIKKERENSSDKATDSGLILKAKQDAKESYKKNHKEWPHYHFKSVLYDVYEQPVNTRTCETNESSLSKK